jgi:transmembrane sensor
MKRQLPAYLLKKYLKGQCTPEEELAVEEWYNSYENESDYLSAISALQKRRLKNRIRSRIDNVIGQGITRNHRLRYLAYAAPGIAACLVIALLFFRKSEQPAVADTRFITVTNTTKNIHKQLLSDGSQVWMMPGACLKYSRAFTGNKREVTLTGESFFEVTKNPLKPFIIYSGNLVTKVWGTSFRVRDAKDLPYADVTVVTGKVSVKLLHPLFFHEQRKSRANMAGEYMIYPNQQVTYLKKTKVFAEKPKPDMTALVIWKKASISFDNKPLDEVIPVLDKAYHVNIMATDNKINNYLLTADLNGMNFPEIMEILHKALDVDYEIKGQDVVLKEANNQ